MAIEHATAIFPTDFQIYRHDSPHVYFRGHTPLLKGLLAEFNKIEQQDIKAEPKEEKGKKMLGGGQQLVMNEAQYKTIVEKIKTIRNSYTLTK